MVPKEGRGEKESICHLDWSRENMGRDGRAGINGCHHEAMDKIHNATLASHLERHKKYLF